MAKKTVGYVHMEWTCPACGTRNPGLEKICQSCGAAQPDDVQFEQAAQETLIEDEQLIDRVKEGADIHCAYCGARNPAGATHCSQCMADLSEGKARQSGRVVGAHRTKPVPDVACPACGTMNPGTAAKCAQCGAVLPKPEKAAQPESQSAPIKRARRLSPIVYVIAGLALVACAAFVFLSLRTEEIVGRVAGASWETNVTLEELLPVEEEAWRDDVPSEGEIVSCREEVRRTQPEPAPNSREVCGTPYTVDTGTGVGEVVQDCEYQVFDEMCTFTIDEWQEVDVVSLTGEDYEPQFPELNLSSNQREGETEEIYRVHFDTDGRSYTYRTDDYDEFVQFEVGSEWVLEVNTFNAVVSASPNH